MRKPGDSKDERTLHYPSFSLRVQPLIAPAQYARLKAENRAIGQQLEQMQQQMESISHKFDSYSPRTKEEKKQVEDYNRVKAKYHPLPTFYFRDLSLSWVYYNNAPFGAPPGSIQEKDWGELPTWLRQREEVARAVLKLLTRYEPVAVE